MSTIHVRQAPSMKTLWPIRGGGARIWVLAMAAKNVKQLDLNLLLVFEALMAQQNVTSAAVTLGLTQSALSHSLVRLRAMCGDPLFVRTPRGMQPTAHAQFMAGPVKQSLDSLRAAIERPGFEPLNESRTFRILMTDHGAIHFLPPLIGYFQEHAPGISIQTVQLPIDQYKAALENGVADLAFTNTLPAEAGFYQQTIFEDRYMVVVGRQHPRIRKKPTLDQYVREQHVRVSLPGWTSHPVDEALRSLNLSRRVQVTVAQYLALPPILSTSQLVATVPSGIYAAMRRDDELASFALPFEAPPVFIRQYWHERKHADPGLVWLRETISRLFGKSAG